MFKYLICFLFLLNSLYSKSQLNITGDRLNVDYSKQHFFLKGNVKLFNQNMEILSQNLTYKKNTKEFNASEKVIASLFKEDTVIHSDVLNKKGSKIIFSAKKKGSVSAVQQGQVTKSQQILMTLNKDKSRIIEFIGEPSIESDVFLITSDNKIIYQTQMKRTDLKGLVNIVLKKDKSKIQSKDILYHNAKNQAIFPTSLTITDGSDGFLKANQGNYNTKTEVLNLLGDVSFIHNQININSQVLKTIVERKETFYIFSKNVESKIKNFDGTSDIIRYSKKQAILQLIGKAAFKNRNNGMLLESKRIDINEKSGKIYFYQNVSIKHQDKKVNGNYGVYNDKTDIFTISGDVKVLQNGSLYNADKATINNRTGVIEMTGNISGSTQLNQLKGIKIGND